MKRIVLADDHPAVRHCVRQALEAEGWDVCGEAATGREAVRMTASQRPDIVVLDVSMPELNGLEAAREIFERFPQTDIYILTMHAVELIPELPGVRAWVAKTDLQLLIDEVRSVRSLPHRPS